MRVLCLAAALATGVSLIVGSAGATDVLKPLRDDSNLVRRLVRIANLEPPPTAQPFRAVSFSISGLQTIPDPRLGDPSSVVEDLRQFAKALTEARLSELQAADIRVLNQEDLEASGLQPCEVLHARITFHFQAYNGEPPAADVVLGATLVEWRRQPIASADGERVVCAGPVTPYALPVFTDIGGPGLFVLKANQQSERASEVKRSLQSILDWSLAVKVVQTSDATRRLVLRWNEGE